MAYPHWKAEAAGLSVSVAASMNRSRRPGPVPAGVKFSLATELAIIQVQAAMPILPARASHPAGPPELLMYGPKKV